MATIFEKIFARPIQNQRDVDALTRSIREFMCEQVALQECLFHALGAQPGMYRERFREDFLRAAEAHWPLGGKSEMPGRIAALLQQFEADAQQLCEEKRD